MEAILWIEVKGDPGEDEQDCEDKEDGSEAATTPVGFGFTSF